MDQLLGKRVRGNVTQYEVKWEGYAETTWEPESNLNGSLVEDWEDAHRSTSEGADTAKNADMQQQRQQRQQQQQQQQQQEEENGSGSLRLRRQRKPGKYLIEQDLSVASGELQFPSELNSFASD